MIEFFRNFHFLRPECLLFLIPIIWLMLKKINISENLSSWSFVCDKKLLDFLLVKSKHKSLISFKTLIYTGLICSTIAASGPAWKKIDVPTFMPENPTMFVLSMTQEMQLTDISPSRIKRAKYAIVDIVQNIKSGQFGLTVYTMEPYIVSPITDDASIITNIMPQVTHDIMPDYGDRPDRAIKLAIKKLQETGFTSGNIVLFASDVGYRLDQTLKEVEMAKSLGFSVNVVDLSFDGSDKLELVAQRGSGLYLKLRENNLALLTKKLSDINEKRMLINKNTLSDYLDYGYYLLIIPLLCVLPLFRRGFLCLFAIFMAFNAEASFLLNNNQEGFRLFQQRKYDEAYKKFDNPIWKSISLYKQDKLEEALKNIEKSKDEISLYNKGVILAKMCRYNEAQKVFEQVVRQFPQNDDAKFNLNTINDLLIKAKDKPSLLECGDNSSSGSGGGNSNNNNNKDNSENNNDDSNGENNTENNNSDNNNESNNNKNDSQNENSNENNSKNDGDKKTSNENKQGNNDKNNTEEGKTDKKQQTDNDNLETKNNEEKKEQNTKNEQQNNADDKKQNNANNQEDDNDGKTGAKNIKKQNESNPSDDKNQKQEEDENKQDAGEDKQNNTSEQNNENNENSKNKNKSDENEEDKSSKSEEKLNKNKEGDGKEDNMEAEQNNKETDKNDDKGDGKEDKSDNKTNNNQNQSKTEANKEKNGNKTDDVDASDKLSNNKNDKESGKFANIGENIDNNEPIDEKDLIIQRKYREIPDDVGGLLREMIKKEHLKGRYKDENI